MNKILVLVGALISVFTLQSVAFAEGDATAGKNIFKSCGTCHDAVKEVKKSGLHLVGIIGWKSASTEGFAYSEAMIAKGTEGMIWDEANITAYLKAPKEFVPGNKMAFSGLKDDQDIVDLIAYLRADPKP